jgi:anti-sigma regulatory factor (Ser/Thr protein kinase)
VTARPRPSAFAASRYPCHIVMSDELELAALPSAVSLTRRFIEAYLRKWGLEELTDTASLIASEIVTNAVKATGMTEQPTDYAALRDASLGRVITRLLWSAAGLFIETWDSDQSQPAPSRPLDLDENGRGLMLIAALSADWGHYPAATGKVVWAQLAIPGPLASADDTWPPGKGR